MNLDPQQLSTRRLYEAMVALITPRPIAWVSTIRRDGVANLAPYSFFNGVGANPPLVMFCPAMRADGTPKDSLANIQANGEFVINLVTAEFFDVMKLTATDVSPDEDEFELASLDRVASSVVMPPRVAGVAAALECRLHTAMQLGNGPGGANLVIGRIVSIYVDPAMATVDGQPDPERIITIGRMGGPRYTRTLDRFE